MKRKHLIELHEQPWMPAFMRRLVTEFLSLFIMQFHVYAPCTQKIAELIQKTHAKKIIDFCSGSGGPIFTLLKMLQEQHDINIPILLSDIFPDQEIAKQLNHNKEFAGVEYSDQPINALNYNESQSSLRTFFTSFHHFKQKEAACILKNAVNSREPIAIFEFTENVFSRWCKDLLIPFFAFRLMPKLKNLGWKRYLFTYFIPIAPLVLLWDGMVSNLRTYSVKELKAMTASLDSEGYVWSVGQCKSSMRHLNLTYLIGYPCTHSESPDE